MKHTMKKIIAAALFGLASIGYALDASEQRYIDHAHIRQHVAVSNRHRKISSITAKITRLFWILWLKCYYRIMPMHQLVTSTPCHGLPKRWANHATRATAMH
jgi:hypothetical protein